MKKILLTLCLIATFFANNAQSWKLKKNSNGIKVYTRVKSETNIVEFKATMQVLATPSELLEIIKQPKKYPEWIKDIEKVKVISMSENVQLLYYIIGFPIGFKNRDVVVLFTISKLPNDSYKVVLKSVPEKYPKQDRYKRINDMYGYWLFKKNGEKTNVTYQVYSDPRGNFPTWIVNIFLVDGPYKIFKNLKKIIQK